MAKCVLTFEDGKKPGELNINLTSEPPFPGPAAEDQKLTVAQAAALDAMAHVVDQSKEEDEE